MRFRKVRIGWSVVWGIVCVLLIVLWVRTYSDDGGGVAPTRPKGPPFALVNISRVAHGRTNTYVFVHQSHWLHNWITNVAVDCAGFKLGWCTGNFPWILTPWFFVGVPLWFPVAIAAGLAAVPWAPQIPHRFSLRTLLIATTLVAVVLGLIVYAVR